MGPECLATPTDPNQSAEHSIGQVFDLFDPPLWLVSATGDEHRGGLIATFVVRASIVSGLPRMLVGLAKHHHTWGLIESCGRFALHLLYPEQIELVWRFGLKSGPAAGKFDGLPEQYTPGGSPLIPQALAWLDCRVEERMDSGDRTIYLAAVETGRANGHAHPLTVQQLYAQAPRDRRQALEDLYARDARIDAEAILSWRSRRVSL